MTGEADLWAAVSARIAAAQMVRRLPGWDGRPLDVPPDLPPLTLLAGQVFPTAMLERRLRFLRLMDWYPDLPADVTLEDRVAVHGISGAEPQPHEMAALTAFFDRQADEVDPQWRDRRPDGGVAAATAWARLEAATMHGDGLFGRRRGGAAWTWLSGLVWWLAENKRRRWG